MNQADNAEGNGSVIVMHPGVERVTVDQTGLARSNKAHGASGQKPLAGRLDSLRGKRLALLDNSKFRAKDLLVAFGKQLQEKYGIAEIKLWSKTASAIGCSFVPEIVNWKPDLFLTASGD